ncbi:MAG: hypothetical protein CM1200mP36_01300 [Gammaproteobacteria bacterium]|nr:MAG: hypothetical protein CM1200mP36_01300 [Gammaproteobacteria bacterium]
MAGPNAQIIPGHGPLATPDDLRDWLQILRITRESMRTLSMKACRRTRSCGAPDSGVRRIPWRGFHESENYNRLLYQSSQDNYSLV